MTTASATRPPISGKGSPRPGATFGKTGYDLQSFGDGRQTK